MILDFSEYWYDRVKAGSKAAEEGCEKLSRLDPNDANFDKKYAGVAKLIEANATDIDNFNKALLACEQSRIEDEKNHELERSNKRREIIDIVKTIVGGVIGAGGLALKWASVYRVTQKEGGDNPEPILGMADRSIVSDAMKDFNLNNLMNWFR